jgi:hypothetical protein
MRTDYGEWMCGNYPTPEASRLKCDIATAQMVEAFPELRRVRGHAMVGIDFRPHWWCVAPCGGVVDPTANQWETPVVFYEPLESEEEPIGKCINCGGLLFRSLGADSHLCQHCH